MQKQVHKRQSQLCLRGTLVPPTPMTVQDKRHTLLTLRNTVQPEQRSEEWYSQREEQITASVFGKLKSIASQRTLAFQKATKIRERPQPRKKHVSSGAACEWGVLFEEVCRKVYEHLCVGAVVEEFGLLPHRTFPFIGASPDGICNEHSSDEYVGRLVEFKAPYSRKLIYNTVPEEYLAQMQGQLEVTQLDCCDYLECVFQKETKEEAHARKECATHLQGVQGLQGFIVQPFGQSNCLYGPVNDITDTTLGAIVATNHLTHEHVNVMYWFLEDYQKVSVRRNSEWFSTNLFPQLETTYTLLTEFVNNDDTYHEEFLKRQQKKKIKRTTVPACLFRN